MLASSRWMGLVALLAFKKQSPSHTMHFPKRPRRLPQIRRHFCVPFLFYGNYPPPPLILPTKTFTIRLNITAFAERK
ncbi:MAG: hypothetical protein ACLUZX_13405 [Subdoligranulum sp.]|jgi:hypothetical protein